METPERDPGAGDTGDEVERMDRPNQEVVRDPDVDPGPPEVTEPPAPDEPPADPEPDPEAE